MTSYNIDWEEQWKLHAPNFKEGHLPLKLNDSTTLKLLPGPGFGDFSHPTTQLMIKMIKKGPLHPIFIDVGSGSGILTLSAAALGVRETYGIEIEPDAVEHARKNAHYNRLNTQFFLPQDFNIYPKKQVTLAINMIRSEQAQAWKSLPLLHGIKGTCYASGVLVEEEADYINEVEKGRGWKHKKTLSSGEWLGFIFEIS